MVNGGQHGVAVGAAAFLCKKHGATPRGLYRDHLQELQNLIFERANYRDALKPQKVKPK
jgi:hypothetical protein